jgi:hypothetical protein
MPIDHRKHLKDGEAAAISGDRTGQIALRLQRAEAGSLGRENELHHHMVHTIEPEAILIPP